MVLMMFRNVQPRRFLACHSFVCLFCLFGVLDCRRGFLHNLKKKVHVFYDSCINKLLSIRAFYDILHIHKVDLTHGIR